MDKTTASKIAKHYNAWLMDKSEESFSRKGWYFVLLSNGCTLSVQSGPYHYCTEGETYETCAMYPYGADIWPEMVRGDQSIVDVIHSLDELNKITTPNIVGSCV